MAKTATVNVQVNSQQFQQLVTSFNALTGQIQRLNRQFAQINATINRTTLSTRALNASMKALGAAAKNVASSVAQITRHFINWHTIIGSVTALLGMGGSLFGIDRMA